MYRHVLLYTRIISENFNSQHNVTDTHTGPAWHCTERGDKKIMHIAFLFWSIVSYYDSDWPEMTQYVAQAGPEFMVILLSWYSTCWAVLCELPSPDSIDFRIYTYLVCCLNLWMKNGLTQRYIHIWVCASVYVITMLSHNYYYTFCIFYKRWGRWIGEIHLELGFFLTCLSLYSVHCMLRPKSTTPSTLRESLAPTCASLAASYWVILFLVVSLFHLLWKTLFLNPGWVLFPSTARMRLQCPPFFVGLMKKQALLRPTPTPAPGNSFQFLSSWLHIFPLFLPSIDLHQCVCLWLSFFSVQSAKFLPCCSGSQEHFQLLSLQVLLRLFPALFSSGVLLQVHRHIWKENIASQTPLALSTVLHRSGLFQTSHSHCPRLRSLSRMWRCIPRDFFLPLSELLKLGPNLLSLKLSVWNLLSSQLTP